MKNINDILNLEEVKKTLDELNYLTNEILSKQNKINEAYGMDKKGYLLKQKKELEAMIDITESEAIMMIQGEGKNAHAIVDGQAVPMTNDTQRKSYMTYVTKEQRKQLAELEGEIARLDTEIFKMKDELEIMFQTAENVRRKAELQARLLQYMAGEK